MGLTGEAPTDPAAMTPRQLRRFARQQAPVITRSERVWVLAITWIPIGAAFALLGVFGAVGLFREGEPWVALIALAMIAFGAFMIGTVFIARVQVARYWRERRAAIATALEEGWTFRLEAPADPYRGTLFFAGLHGR